MSREQIAQLREDAGALALEQRYTEARDTMVVAADVAETDGHSVEAWLLRAGARRMHVTAWARERYGSHLTPENVFGQRVEQGGETREVRRFRIDVRDRGGRLRQIVRVSVGVRGRVTIVSWDDLT